MAATSLIPPAFWFQWKIDCPHISAPIPASGRIWTSSPKRSLPQTTSIDGRVPWWSIAAGWNRSGLFIGLDVMSGRAPARARADHPELADGLQLWIDTRDTRDIHRASRYCHRFLARVVPDRKSKSVNVELEQLKIHRAQADAPSAEMTRVVARAGLLSDGWWLDLFFPASELTGFDPETNSRLGFMYSLHDSEVGDQFPGIGREFPIGEDPSLWWTLELLAPEEPTAAPKPRRTTSKN